MEVVGAIASIVTLIDVGKKLKDCIDKVRNKFTRFCVELAVEGITSYLRFPPTDTGSKTLQSASIKTLNVYMSLYRTVRLISAFAMQSHLWKHMYSKYGGFDSASECDFQ